MNPNTVLASRECSRAQSPGTGCSKLTRVALGGWPLNTIVRREGFPERYCLTYLRSTLEPGGAWRLV